MKLLIKHIINLIMINRKELIEKLKIVLKKNNDIHLVTIKIDM